MAHSRPLLVWAEGLWLPWLPHRPEGSVERGVLGCVTVGGHVFQQGANYVNMCVMPDEQFVSRAEVLAVGHSVLCTL